jgi:hypothetical protein
MKTERITFQMAGLSDDRKTDYPKRTKGGGILTPLLFIAGIACTCCQENKIAGVTEARLINSARPTDTVYSQGLPNSFTPHINGARTSLLHRWDSMRQPDLFHDLYFENIPQRVDSVSREQVLKKYANNSARKKSA